MNTSKQVNVMIGLMFLAVIIFAANVLNEPHRSDAARETQTETFAKRGAELFVANCRACHGLQGLGSGEGAIAPALNNKAYLIINDQNMARIDAAYAQPGQTSEVTPDGIAQGIRKFLTETISCGRKGTFMPVWSENHGGTLSDTQIEYIVTMITEGRWDIVAEVTQAHDSKLNPVPTAADILSDGSGLSLTQKNCGQYDALTAKDIHDRDPFVSAAGGGGGGEATATATPGGGGGGPADGIVQGINVGDFFLANCSPCHGQHREGLVGPALTPERLTQPDQFYFDTIKNGRPGTVMPPWGQQGLTDADINALVQFLKNVEPQ